MYAQTTTTKFGANAIAFDSPYFTQAISENANPQTTFSEGMIATLKGDYSGWGFLNTNGDEVIPFIYDWAWNFSDGLAAVVKDDKIGFVDKTGKEVIPCIYDNINGTGFSDGLAAVVKDGKIGFIDQTGAEAIPFIYDGAFSFSEGFASVKIDGKSASIDTTGAEIIPFTDDFLGSVVEGLIPVRNGENLWGYVDTTGAEVVPCVYSTMQYFVEGLAGVSKDGELWGYIDQTGAEIIPCIYQDVNGFSEGLSAVTKDGELWGYIDQTGAEVIPFIYKKGHSGTIGAFSEGLAYISDGNFSTESQYIDKTGAVVLNTRGTSSAFVDGHTFLTGLNMDPDVAYTFSTYDSYILKNPLLYPVTEVEVATAETPTTTPAESTDSTYKSAKSTTSLVTVNGQSTDFDAYLIEGNNYFKLRDLAYAFTGTGKQFEVTWDAAQSAINLLSGQAYTIAGGEMAPASGYTKSASPSSSQLLLNGTPISLSAYVIEGNTYFKLRDICEQLDIEVTWDETKKVIGING